MVLSTDKDDYVTCPLDKAHRILKSRLQFHMVRCLRNHTLVTKIRCPWNPLHFVERCEYLDHLTNKCTDLANVMGSRIVTEEHVDVASIPVGTANRMPNSNTEDWDAEPFVATYDPLKRINDQPILRSSIGLSKAKKKQFKLQERRRHQRLEEMLPIQNNTAARFVEEVNAVQPPRTPYSQPIAMSATASIAKKLNSSKISENFEKGLNQPETLRQPHGLSPGLFYKVDKKNASMGDKKTTTLCTSQSDTLPDDDTKTCVSDTGSQSPKIEAIQGAIKKSTKTPETHFASVLSEMIEKSDDESIKIKEIVLQDEAACLPPEIIISPEDDVEKLAEELANLETMEREIKEKRAKVLQIMSKDSYEYDDETTKENNPGNCNQQNDLNKINRKCAAGFGNLLQEENLPKSGFGRGVPLNLAAFENFKLNGNTEN
ncbi:uncharacterized protein [Venturia canescens]|uniref:uncharacterized protein isoform X1 n=1 Tax=Venturia canescens TaxID=32260 RepID=UPI001C9CFF1D|nr:uncharacterized protein LOC122408939 isoform X1 [Venturia canescens]